MSPADLQLLEKKSGHTRLGFALLLKAFQYEGRFPRYKNDLPSAVVAHVAAQVSVGPEEYLQYDWRGRSIEYHRAQIRAHLGYRAATLQDSEELVAWLLTQEVVYDRQIDHLKAAVYARCRPLHLEPPTPERVDRLVRSAMHTAEERLCATILSRLPAAAIAEMDALLDPDAAATEEAPPLHALKADPGRISLERVLTAIAKLQRLRRVAPRGAAEPPRELRAHAAPIRYTLLAALCLLRGQAAGGEQTLRDVVREHHARGRAYTVQVHTVMRRSYAGHYRRMVPVLLEALRFRSSNTVHRPVIRALRLLKAYTDSRVRYYPPEEEVPLDGVVREGWREIVVERDKAGQTRINRVNYEICVLQALRDGLRSREIWVEGAARFGNPDRDVPGDFEAQRDAYYAALRQPREAATFIATLQQEMRAELEALHRELPRHRHVQILTKGNGWIKVSPLDPVPDPVNLARLKAEIGVRWPMTGLLDILKELGAPSSVLHRLTLQWDRCRVASEMRAPR